MRVWEVRQIIVFKVDRYEADKTVRDYSTEETEISLVLPSKTSLNEFINLHKAAFYFLTYSKK